jgi:hypothetical protein
MIILFYSEQCQFCVKLLDYICKNNLKKYFKMINVDTATKIPNNVTIVPTIIDTTIEAPLEGKYALEYLFNQKYFNHPTNNIEFWLSVGVPIPSIEEDKKAVDKFKISNYACFNDDNNAQNNVVVIKNKIKTVNKQSTSEQTRPEESTSEQSKNESQFTDKKTLALLKLRRR